MTSIRTKVIDQITTLRELRRLHELTGATLQLMDEVFDAKLENMTVGAEPEPPLPSDLPKDPWLAQVEKAVKRKKTKAGAKRKYTKKSKWWAKKGKK